MAFDRRDCLVVTDKANKMEGILTERDFLKLPLEQGAARRTTVAELMTPASRVTSATTSCSMNTCVALMREKGFRHLPVVENGEVRRVIGMQDVCEELRITLSKSFFMPVVEDITVADLLATVPTPGLSRWLPPDASVQDGIEAMRESKFGAVLVLEDLEDLTKPVGVFAERDYLFNVVPYDEVPPSEVSLREVSRFAMAEFGFSQRTMQSIARDPNLANRYRPDVLTCVERSTLLRDCLNLMIGTGLLYVPVVEAEQPVDIITMRDIMLYLAQE